MRIVTKVISALCCAALSAGVWPVQAAAAEVEKTPSGLKISEIQDAVKDYTEQNKSDYACFSAAVFDRDSILFADGFGHAEPSGGRKADASTSSSVRERSQSRTALPRTWRRAGTARGDRKLQRPHRRRPRA